MTASTADVRTAMTNTITRFLETAGDPARGWTTPRDGAERLAALLLQAEPIAGSPAAAQALGMLAATRSLRRLRRQEARPLGIGAPLPSWSACADDHCRTVQHCTHESAAQGATGDATGRFAGARDADPAHAARPVVAPVTKAELAPAS